MNPKRPGADGSMTSRTQFPSVDQLQPIPAIRRRGRRRRRIGCLRFVLWYAAGLGLGCALLVSSLLLANWLFPPQPTTILLLGLDRRPGESIISRSDTLILVHVDPREPAVALLSLPRDLYLDVPGRGPSRINTAHVMGESERRGGGPQLALETVRANFGLPVRYYLRLDFEGFVRIVDSLGGVTVEVERSIVDYEYPTHDYRTQVVSFEAGRQHLNGERALQYARIRHGSSDFVRARRQQQLVAALVQRSLQPSAWVRLPALARTVAAASDTNVDPITALRLAPTIVAVGSQGIERYVIEGSMVQPYRTASGAAVQQPVWSEIEPLLRERFDK